MWKEIGKSYEPSRSVKVNDRRSFLAHDTDVTQNLGERYEQFFPRSAHGRQDSSLGKKHIHAHILALLILKMVPIDN